MRRDDCDQCHFLTDTGRADEPGHVWCGYGCEHGLGDWCYPAMDALLCRGLANGNCSAIAAQTAGNADRPQINRRVISLSRLLCSGLAAAQLALNTTRDLRIFNYQKVN